MGGSLFGMSDLRNALAVVSISDFIDHATFRKKDVNTVLVRLTWGFLLFET